MSRIGETRVGDSISGVSTTFDAAIGSVLRLSGTVGLGGAIDLALPSGESNALLYGDQILNLTLAPVPEADTWAMLLAGLALVGFATRRRG